MVNVREEIHSFSGSASSFQNTGNPNSQNQGPEAQSLVIAPQDLVIETLDAKGLNDASTQVCDLIRRGLSVFAEAGTVLASTFRRIDKFASVYSMPGSSFIVARDASRGGICIGAAGIGPLHGLAPEEGLGEVRDFVVDKAYRGRNIGARLLRRCLEEAKPFGYNRIYLETTPEMEPAQKLFLRFGFRPITQGPSSQHSGNTNESRKAEALPCYFILDRASANEGTQTYNL